MVPRTLILLGVALVVLGVSTGTTLGVFPGLILMIIGIVSKQWIRHSLNRVYPTFSLEKRRAFPGQEVYGYIELQNDQPFPIPRLRLFMDWPPRLDLPHGKELVLSADTHQYQLAQDFALRWFERVKRRFTICCAWRGEFSLGPLEVRASDFFGFGQAIRNYDQGETIIVYPRQVPIHVTRALPRSPLGQRWAASWLYEDPVLFRGTRDYQPSDPFSRIEWKTTARIGTIQTRELDASFTASIVLIVDVVSDTYQWKIDRSNLERNLVLASSLLKEWQEQKLVYGVYTNGVLPRSRIPACVGLGGSPDHYRLCLETLGRLLPSFRKSCSEVLASCVQRLSRDTHFVVISGVLKEPLLTEVHAARQKGRALTLIYSGQEDPPPLGVPIYGLQEEEEWNELERITLSPLDC